MWGVLRYVAVQGETATPKPSQSLCWWRSGALTVDFTVEPCRQGTGVQDRDKWPRPRAQRFI